MATAASANASASRRAVLNSGLVRCQAAVIKKASSMPMPLQGEIHEIFPQIWLAPTQANEGADIDDGIVQAAQPEEQPKGADGGQQRAEQGGQAQQRFAPHPVEADHTARDGVA
jgi:hypothetical protein